MRAFYMLEAGKLVVGHEWVLGLEGAPTRRIDIEAAAVMRVRILELAGAQRRCCR